MLDLEKRRELLKTSFKELQFIETDQNKGFKPPPATKPILNNVNLIDLPKPEKISIINKDIFELITNRKSYRNFEDRQMSLIELSFLLWSTQGVKKKLQRDDLTITFRTVPSAGARHPFETYLAINNVNELKPGIYIYRPIEHKLEFLKMLPDLQKRLIEGSLGQKFVGNCNVVFIWSTLPYRTEWRYDFESAKLILLDAGHLCQNLYLACEAIGMGTCAIGAFDTEIFNSILDLDSKDEFVIYLSPVGYHS